LQSFADLHMVSGVMNESVARGEAVGLKEVAARLGVSVATASRALSESKFARVSPELRSRIQLVARELGYTPHPAAQMLRKPKTQLLTVLMPLSSDSFISDYMNGIMSGIVTTARDLEMEVRVALLDADGDDILDQVSHAGIGAGSIVLIGRVLSPRQVVRLEDVGRPIVIMDACLPPNMDLAGVGVSTVGTNNRECFYDLTLELLKLGHRRVAFINGPEHMHDAYERRQGYVQALTEYRIPIDHQAIVHQPYTTEGGALGWTTLKQRGVRPTAVLCGSDDIAFGVLEKFAEEKIACPEEISVAGYDDSRLAARISPSLTTVRQPIIEMGRTVVEMLGEQARKSPVDRVVEHRVLPGQIVWRKSVAAPRPDSP
jgi:DNA-binding LacI/PurR family transcriptional regulator